MVLTEDPGKFNHYRIVVRTNTHKRPRLDNSRFNAPILAKFHQNRDMKFEKDDLDQGIIQSNWLGMTWTIKHNKNLLPSLA